jgi:hypothetical protein
VSSIGQSLIESIRKTLVKPYKYLLKNQSLKEGKGEARGEKILQKKTP